MQSRMTQTNGSPGFSGRFTMSGKKEFVQMGREWITTKSILAIGLMLGTAFMVSGGPQFQETLVALFDVSRVSLYESIVPDGIALDRGLKPWILAAFEMPWLITGMVAALVTVQMKSWRGMVITMGVTVAGALTVLDIVIGTIYGVMTIDDLITDISANILGGISNGVALFLILWMSMFVGKAIGAGQEHQGIVTGTIAAIFGLSVSMVLYVAMATVLQPKEVQARVLAKLPVQGVIGKAYPKDEDGEEGNRFQFLSQSTKVERVDLRGKGLEWDWKRVDEGVRYSIVVYVVGGCSELDQVQELSKEEPIIEIRDAERVHIAIDGFVNQIILEGQQTDVSVERGTVTKFWIDKNNSGKGINLTEFLSGETISGDTYGDMAFLVTAMTFQDGEGVIQQATRTFDLKINDEKIQIVFGSKFMDDIDQSLSCRSLKQELEATRVNNFEDVALAGLYAEIRRTRAPEHYWVNIDGQYSFHNAGGWFQRHNVLHSGLLAAGELGMIVIQTPVHEMFVNGKRHEIPIGAGFRGHGEISASYDEVGGLTFSGDFHAAWLDEQRLNQTQWERWTFDAKLAVLAIIVSLAGGIVTLIYRTRNTWRTYV